MQAEGARRVRELRSPADLQANPALLRRHVTERQKKRALVAGRAPVENVCPRVQSEGTRGRTSAGMRSRPSSRRVRANWFTLSQSFRVCGSPAATLRVDDLAAQRAEASRCSAETARVPRVIIGSCWVVPPTNVAASVPWRGSLVSTIYLQIRSDRVYEPYGQLAAHVAAESDVGDQLLAPERPLKLARIDAVTDTTLEETLLSERRGVGHYEPEASPRPDLLVFLDNSTGVENERMCCISSSDGYKIGYKIVQLSSCKKAKGPRLRAFLSSGGRI